jgi:glycosyltransferase involved in cell wall biosynthesis
VCHVTTLQESNPYFSALAELHDRESCELSLITLGPQGSLHHGWKHAGLPAFNVHVAGRRSAARAVWQLSAYLRAQRYDIVQTHLLEATILGAVASRLARVPLLVATAHHTNESVLQQRMRGKTVAFLADRIAVRLCHRVIAPSPFAKAALVESYGVHASRIAVVPFGLPPRAVESSARATVRHEFGLGDDVVFIAVGRLHWIKAIPTVLEAFKLVAMHVPDVRLLIVGGGPDAAILEELVARMGLIDRVKLPGHRNDVARLLEAADAFVHGSLTESFNQALVEALNAGKPVVSTAVGIAENLIEHRQTGFLARPGHVQDLIDGMLWVLANRNAWDEIGQRNRAAAAHLTYSRMLRGYEAVYRAWTQ